MERTIRKRGRESILQHRFLSLKMPPRITLKLKPEAQRVEGTIRKRGNRLLQESTGILQARSVWKLIINPVYRRGESLDQDIERPEWTRRHTRKLPTCNRLLQKECSKGVWGSKGYLEGDDRPRVVTERLGSRYKKNRRDKEVIAASFTFLTVTDPLIGFTALHIMVLLIRQYVYKRENLCETSR
jgi:hypothetical protein